LNTSGGKPPWAKCPGRTDKGVKRPVTLKSTVYKLALKTMQCTRTCSTKWLFWS